MHLKSYGTSLRAVLAAFVLMFSVAGLSAQQKAINPAEQYDVYTTEYAQKVIGFLASEKLNGREAGTKEAAKSARVIAKEFKKMGYAPQMQSYTREQLVEAIGEPKAGKPLYPLQECNVIASLEGKVSDKFIVVGAHYDHLGYKEGLGIHPGADDNASGIVALLSLAKMMKESGVVPEYTVLFCAWDGEEKGLHGSRYFVKTWPYCKETLSSIKESVVCYMNFDMVGRTVTPENPAVTFAWNNNYPYLLDICKEVQESIPAPFQVLLDERRGDGKGGSDYAPFSALDIPFIAWMEDFMHEDYHKPTDTQEKIHWEKLRKTTLLAYGILMRLATGVAR